MLYLRDASFLDWRNLKLRRGHLAVEPGAQGKVRFVPRIPRGARAVDCSGRLVTKSFVVAHHHLYSALACGMPMPKRAPKDFPDMLKLVWWNLDRKLDKDMIRACAMAGGIAAAKAGAHVHGLAGALVAKRLGQISLTAGDVLKESVNYAVGAFNGSADLASSNAQDADNNNDKDVLGRVFVQPFKNYGPEALKGLGLGVGGSYGHNEGATTPTYKSAGQANIFSYTSTTSDGPHLRVSPQAYFYKGGLGLIGEYAVSEQKVLRVSSGNIMRDSFSNTAWQVTGNYVWTDGTYQLALLRGTYHYSDVLDFDSFGHSEPCHGPACAFQGVNDWRNNAFGPHPGDRRT